MRRSIMICVVLLLLICCSISLSAQQALRSLYGGKYNYYLHSTHRDSAMKYAMKAEENAYAAGDSSKYYYIQLQLGEFYTPIDFEKAISYYQRSFEYYERTQNFALQA